MSDNLSPKKKMTLLSDLFSIAFGDLTEITTGKYRPILLSDFFRRLNNALTDLGKCTSRFFMEDSIRIVQQVYPALKHIASDPGYELVRKDEKVPLHKLTNTDAKTMRWLSGRPGRTFEEKIYPENHVLTTRHYRSYDTKENREALWLYRALRKEIDSQWQKSPCAECSEECPFAGIRIIRGLIELEAKFSSAPFTGVKAEKQFVRNNRLMSDKYYRVISDASSDIKKSESRVEKILANIEERWINVDFWIFFSLYYSKKDDLLIYDDLVEIQENEGELALISLDAKQGQKITSFQVIDKDNPLQKITYSCDSDKGITEKGKKEIIFGYFGIEKIVWDGYEIYD